MNTRLERTLEILSDLIGYRTVSSESNLELIDYAAELLAPHATSLIRTSDPGGTKASLFATLGPAVDGGVVLSGHTDVVPVEGQEWTFDPFQAAIHDGRVWGRGSTDMKGFIACVLAMLPELVTSSLRRPLHVALTHDEEVGCLGAQAMLAALAEAGPLPAVALVGEPTRMRIIEGHKGCYEYTTEIRGLEGHASLPGRSVSAIHAAVRFITKLSELQAELRERAPNDSIFDPPYTTINVGTIEGGVARNITAGSARFEWEMRPVQTHDAQFVLESLERFLEAELLPEMREVFPEAAVATTTVGAVDGLEPEASSPAATLAAELVGVDERGIVPFGTEAGLYQALGISAVVCGPGDIAQAHTPDEFIEIDQLEACLRMLDRLRGKLA